jgi:hypothetical protein
MRVLPALKWVGQVLVFQLLLAFLQFSPARWGIDKPSLDMIVAYIILSTLGAGLLLLRTVDEKLTNSHG